MYMIRSNGHQFIDYDMIGVERSALTMGKSICFRARFYQCAPEWNAGLNPVHSELVCTKP
jgi:hypothetical protein